MNEYTAGHRQRIRERYIENKERFGDYELLELLLTFAIPRIDVKPIANELLKHFCTLENIFDSTPEQLMQVDGVGENTAILINLFDSISDKISKNKNNNIIKIDSEKKAIDYFINYFSVEHNERIVAVSLDNSNKVIATRVLSNGIVNSSEISMRRIMEMVSIDNSSGIIVAHNHPRGVAEPSVADISFTLKMRDFLRTVNVRFLDHIIVGEEDALSMHASPDYKNYFTK